METIKHRTRATTAEKSIENEPQGVEDYKKKYERKIQERIEYLLDNK